MYEGGMQKHLAEVHAMERCYSQRRRQTAAGIMCMHRHTKARCSVEMDAGKLLVEWSSHVYTPAHIHTCAHAHKRTTV